MATNTITKIMIGFLIVISMFIGYLSFISDIYNNYDVDNTTGYITELNDVVDSSVNSIENQSKVLSRSVQNVEELNFIGVITGTIVNAVKLPFQFIYMILKVIVTIFGMLPLPMKVLILITSVIFIVISLGILKIILGRSDI